jgi:hypothetical protein
MAPLDHNGAVISVGSGYDVIGDVHGQAGKLVGLLDVLGYREQDGVWRHPDRTAVFIGDLIDRGPQQLETIEIVRPMVSAGAARIVLGNHEFNAIAYATPDPAKPGEYLRTRFGDDGPRHRVQHEAFLDAVGEDSSRHLELVEWFRTFPMWLDLGGLRAVHACWHERSFEALAGATLTRALVEASSRNGTPEYAAVEIILKGPEIELGDYHCYLDPDDHPRTTARYRWWDPKATTLRAAAEIPGGAVGCDGEPFGELPDDPIDPPVPPYVDDVPVIVGHYWRTGEPKVITSKVACVDFSAAKAGPLVAYRWSRGETELTSGNLIWST